MENDNTPVLSHLATDEATHIYQRSVDLRVYYAAYQVSFSKPFCF